MAMNTQQLTGADCLTVGSSHSGLTKSKEKVHHMDLGATGRLKVQVWHKWTVGAYQLMEDLHWRLGNCEYWGPDLVPMLAKP